MDAGKSRLDDENVIMEDVRDVQNRDVCFVTESAFEKYLYKSIMLDWPKWTVNNGHDAPPPDYFSTSHKLMFDVMRINDSEITIIKSNGDKKFKNQILAKEKSVLNEIKSAFPSIPSRNIHINVMPDEDYDKTHNYKQYYEHANRVFDDHIKSVPMCRDLHPDYKMGFLVMDETESYLKHQNILDAQEPLNPNKLYEVDGIPHLPFIDKRIIQRLLQGNIEFLIWFSPYKHNQQMNIQPPKLTFFDLSKKDAVELINYPSYLMRRM